MGVDRRHGGAGGREDGGLAAGCRAQVEHAHPRPGTDALRDQHGRARDRDDGTAREGVRAGDVERTLDAQDARGLVADAHRPRLLAARRPRPRLRRAADSATARAPAGGSRPRTGPFPAPRRTRRTTSRRSSRAASGAAPPPRDLPRAAQRTTRGPRPRCGAAPRSSGPWRALRWCGGRARRSRKPLHAAGFRRRRGSGRRRAGGRARGPARAAARAASRSPRARRRASGGAAPCRTRGAWRARGRARPPSPSRPRP